MALRPALTVLLLIVSMLPPCIALAQGGSVHATDERVLHGGDPGVSERRGVSVACSGDGERVIVGSAHSGARIFHHVGDDWLVEPHGLLDRAQDEPGLAVAMSADGLVALVGIPGDGRIGAVRVLVRRDTGWMNDAVLRPSDGAQGDRFGSALALSADGSRALIGVPNDDSPDDDAGSARVFTRHGAYWDEEATLLAPRGARRDGLGAAVALSADGTIAILGAPRDDTDVEEDAGSAQVFALGETGWTRVAFLQPRDLARRDLFGSSVALSADGARALVGAPGDDVDEARDAGSARPFSRVDDAWRAEPALLGLRGRPMDAGSSVALSADGAMALVGARRAGGNGAGLAFALTSTGWISSGTIAAREPGGHDFLGWSVALSSDGTRAVLGAPGDTVDGAEAAGSARAVSLVPGGYGGTGGLTEVFDAGMRAYRAEPWTRTPEEEERIRVGGIGALVGGAVGVAGGLVLLFAGLFSDCDATFLGGVSCGGNLGMIVSGGVLGGLGVISVITGAILFSQRTHGRRSPRATLSPTDGGAYAELSLDF
jgi:hypothetical protein